jgi:hypothetical protein
MADKGVRLFVNAKFVEMLPTRINTRAGNTAFRKTVMCAAMEECSITLAAASTHYNHAFICARLPHDHKDSLQVDPALLEGLGRPEDKKGGRKPKVKAEVVVPTTPEPAASTEALLLGYNGVQTETPAAEETAVELPDFQAVQEAFAHQAEQVAEAAAAQIEAAESAMAVVVETMLEDTPALFNVLAKKSGALVQANVTEEVARSMITAACRAKKAKLRMEPVA